MNYDFDRVVDRRNTNSLKYDFAVEQGLPEDVLPLWVADMDFPVAEPIREAMQRVLDRGIFGYSDAKEDYVQAVTGWFRDRFQWEPDPAWLVRTPGVVFALATAVRALTEPGDHILIQPPVYYPFFSVVRGNGRVVEENRLLYDDGRYSVDFEDFERRIRENQVRMFILCSPHNPVCRVWTREELRKMGEICARYGVIVVSDEIHCDFTLPGHPHTVFLNACPELTDQTVICTAPSKTFNLAGLQASNIWIPNKDLRGRFQKEIRHGGGGNLNLMGITACQAAYEGGGEWLDQCKEYLRGNLDFVREFLKERIPSIRLVEPEGTYFAWMDCSGLGLDRKALEDLVVQKARLWLDGGHLFGGDADLFQRVVLACPRATLREGMERLERAVNSLG